MDVNGYDDLGHVAKESKQSQLIKVKLNPNQINKKASKTKRKKFD